MIPTAIIIHHSLTADGQSVSWQAIRRYHIERRGWRDIGYHYGIERIIDRHEILVGRMPDEPGAHCKEGGMNSRSLGICVVGDFDRAPPADDAVDLLIRLVRSLMRLLSIPPEHVYRHSDFAVYKTCPGRYFPWTEFSESIRRT